MIRDLNKVMNIPSSLAEYGITKEDFEANVDFIAENAIKDACTGSNPRSINVDEMKKYLIVHLREKKLIFNHR